MGRDEAEGGWRDERIRARSLLNGLIKRPPFIILCHKKARQARNNVFCNRRLILIIFFIWGDTEGLLQSGDRAFLSVGRK